MTTESNSPNSYIGHDLNSLSAIGSSYKPTADIISSSSPLKFNLTYGSGTPAAAIAAVEAAASQWAAQFTDDITLNIYVDFGDLPESILGGARPNMVEVKYHDVLTGMVLDKTSKDDTAAFSAMELDYRDSDKLRLYEQGNLELDELAFSDQSSFSMLIDGSFSSSVEAGKAYLDANGNQNNKTIWMTSANAKALGLIEKNASAFDAWLRFNDLSTLWDFDARDGVQADQYDFSTVVRHELGHALGFVSGSDIQSTLMMTGGSSTAINGDDLAYVSMLDLFRYSDESAAQSVVKKYQNVDSGRMPEIVVQGVNDWTLGRVDATGNAIDYYFSLDRGQTKIASLAKGIAGIGSDGYQASHWAAGDLPLGVMTPNLKPGQSIDIAELDIRMLDVLGFDRRNATNLTSTAGLINLDQTFGISRSALSKAVGEAIQGLELDRNLMSDWMAEQRQHVVEQGIARRNQLDRERDELAQWHRDAVMVVEQQLATNLSVLEAGQSAEQRQIAEQLRRLEADRSDQEAQIWKRLESDLAALEARQTEGQRQTAQAIRQIDAELAIRQAKVLQTLKEDLAALENNYLTGLRLSWKEKQDLSETLQKQAYAQIDSLTEKAKSNRESLEDKLSEKWVDQVENLKEQTAEQVKELNKRTDNQKKGLEGRLSKGWQDKIKNLKAQARKSIENLNETLEDKSEDFDDREKDLDNWVADLNKSLDKQKEAQMQILEKLEETQIKRAEKLVGETDDEEFEQEQEGSETITKLQEEQNEALLKIAEKQLEELAKLSSQLGFDSPLSRSRSGSTTSDSRYWLSRSRSGSTTSSTAYWQSAFLPGIDGLLNGGSGYRPSP